MDASGSAGGTAFAAGIASEAVAAVGPLTGGFIASGAGGGPGAGDGSTNTTSVMIVSLHTSEIDGGCVGAGEGIGNSGCSGSGTTVRCARSVSSTGSDG